MQGNKKWAKVGVVLTIVGLLTGCGTADNRSTPATNTSNSVLPNASISVNSDTVYYTNAQITEILSLGRKAGLPTVFVPRKGFGSRFLYAQNVVAFKGGNILVLNFNRFSIQEYIKPMLQGRTVMKIVQLNIPGSKTPFIGAWNAPPIGSGAQPILSFKMMGVYFLIPQPTSLSLSKIEEIAESLSQA